MPSFANEAKEWIEREYGGASEVVDANVFLIQAERDMKKLASPPHREVLKTFGLAYAFEPPQLDFPARSLVVVAMPSPIARVVFTWKGKEVPIMIPPTYVGMYGEPARIETRLNTFLKPHGHHVKVVPRLLPKKILAARSGLCAYGKNNLCYRKDTGSFANLAVFYSDIPGGLERVREIERMPSCATCNACANACPTGAVRVGERLIDPTRCLTFFNEQADVHFPNWIARDDHHCLYGCMQCQLCCPHNWKFLNDVVTFATFTEQETALLLEGVPPTSLPEELADKVRSLDMVGYLSILPRNLRFFLQ